MIDLHCHILDGIDDGAKTIKDTLEMAVQAAKLGYTKIFATPHFMDYVFETNKTEVLRKVAYANKLLESLKINVTLYPANEIYFSEAMENNLKGMDINCLGNSRYILIEFPMNGKILNVEEVVAGIINQGYIPIIAHPERYEFVQKDYNSLKALLKIGALAQINISSISKQYGLSAQKTVTNLLKQDMVHFIATDAHDPKKVYSVYEKSLKKIKKIITEKKLEELMYLNPELVVNNAKISSWKQTL